MRLSRHSYSTLRSIQGPLVFVDSVIEARMGEVVTIVPNHACGCTNLHDEVVVHRGGRVVGVWPVTARGKLR